MNQRDYPRSRRVADQIQRELAELIRDHVRDPRLGFYSITGVDVSRDIAHAEVHVSALGEPEAATTTAEVLNHAAGFLRGELGRRMRLRHVPQLRFHADTSIADGIEMSRKIDRAVAEDRRRAASSGSNAPDAAGSDGDGQPG